MAPENIVRVELAQNYWSIFLSIINALSGIGAASAAIAAFIGIRRMKRDRELLESRETPILTLESVKVKYFNEIEKFDLFNPYHTRGKFIITFKNLRSNIAQSFTYTAFSLVSATRSFMVIGGAEYIGVDFEEFKFDLMFVSKTRLDAFPFVVFVEFIDINNFKLSKIYIIDVDSVVEPVNVFFDGHSRIMDLDNSEQVVGKYIQRDELTNFEIHQIINLVRDEYPVVKELIMHFSNILNPNIKPNPEGLLMRLISNRDERIDRLDVPE